MKYLLTQDSVTVVIGGKPYSISSQSPGFSDVRDSVVRGDDPVKVLGVIQAKAEKVQEVVRETLRRQSLTGKLTYEEGVILYEGKPLFNYAVEVLVKFLNLGHNVSALAKFIEKQQQNPLQSVHDELYRFLEFGKIPLTPDGDFLVYKAVRADFKDIHSGTFDNAVGAKPRLTREAVDPDRNQTCSRGLHVCSYGYLPHFANAEGHVMVCKVDPRDVVAIPTDYNNTKMRVAGYEVVGEVTEYYKRGTDVLSEERLRDPERWVVQYEGQVYDTFFDRSEAEGEARDVKLDNPSWSVQVYDSHKNEVVYVA